MNKSVQRTIKYSAMAIWSVIDYLLYAVGLFDDLENFKFIVAFVVWLVVLLIILLALNRLLKEWS